MYQLLRFVAPQARLLEAGVLNLPLSSGKCWFSLGRLFSKGGAVKHESSVTTSEKVQAFQQAYRDHFGVDPLISTCARFAKVDDKDVAIRKLDEWIAAFGKTVSERIIRLRPSLLTRNVPTLTARLAGVCSLYGWNQEEGMHALKKNYNVICCTLEHQTRWREQVSKILEVEAELSKMVLKFPTLLNLSFSNITAKLSSLHAAFSGANEDVKADVRQMVVRAPALLALKPESVKSKIVNLVSELDTIVHYDARQVFLAFPKLLTFSSSTLMRKFHEIKSACLKDPSWMEALQGMKPKSLANCLVFDEKAIARLKFYQRSPRETKFAFSTLLGMSEDRFNTLYPGFEKWWKSEHPSESKSRHKFD